jgi:Cd2+/Zn2+-exporting ATPase/Cu+-exporting ATPase
LRQASHVVSELVFILNSARLLPTPEKTVTMAPELKPETAKH